MIPDRQRVAVSSTLEEVVTIVLAHGLTVAVAEPSGRESVAGRLAMGPEAASWFRGALESSEVHAELACGEGDLAAGVGRRAEQAAIAVTRRLRADVGVGVFQDPDRERADGSRATGVAVHVGPLTLSADYTFAGSPRVVQAHTVDRALSLLLSGLRVHLGVTGVRHDVGDAAPRGASSPRRRVPRRF